MKKSNGTTWDDWLKSFIEEGRKVNYVGADETLNSWDWDQFKLDYYEEDWTPADAIREELSCA